jgi:hypothetical protein
VKSEARDYYGHTKDEAKETSDRLFGWGQRKVDEGKEEARRAEEQGEREFSKCLGVNLSQIFQHAQPGESSCWKVAGKFVCFHKFVFALFNLVLLLFCLPGHWLLCWPLPF